MDGNIHLQAATGVLVGSGFIRTMGGGNIEIKTTAGDVDAGTKTDGYLFNRFGPLLSPNGLGGIATGRGGSITIEAGGDIVTGPSAIGAYDAGDVTLTAGRNIEGRFLLHDGAGAIEAGYDFGSSGSPASLALSKGGWSVKAGHDIYLNEVYNPNGSLNGNRAAFGAGVRFQFDYDAAASVYLEGGHGVHLLGNNPVRTANNPGRLPIYAPKLEVRAGAGGIELGNDIVLAPSALGSLRLFTTHGGSLFTTPGRSHQLVMSDSGSPDYTTFVQGHAATPLHLDNRTDGVTADISGDITDVLLQVPKQSLIHVHGNTLNFAFEGQNLNAGETTSIIVDGDIRSRGNRTSVEEVTPNKTVFDEKYTVNALLGNKLVFDSKTHQLSFIGKMTETERDFLLNPQVRQYDSRGNLIVDALGDPILASVSYLDSAKVLALYQNSQDIPSSANALRGIQVGGPGRLVVGAHNVDLGITEGIRSRGTLNNPALNGISPKGVNIELNVQNLEMGASQIASFAGGSITVNAAGRVDVGSQNNFTSDDTPKGIFTSSGGNVTVHATDDINVNGSRIATYDGGNISIVSEAGDINAGSGGLGSVLIFRTSVDPVTGLVTVNTTSIPGSGILATTLPGGDTRIGNISIEAKDGSVIASKGGVLQLSFNGVKENDSATILISAKGHGNNPLKGNIEAKNSGIIGGNVTLNADGDITGLVVAKQDINIDSKGNVSVTALAQGSANVSGASISGSTIVGGESVSASAATISDSSLVSSSVSSSGTQSGVQSGVGTTAAATATKVSDDADKTVASTKKEDEEEDPKKKKKPIQLARTSGRVTVILPNQPK